MKGLILAALMLCASAAWAEEVYPIKIFAAANAVTFNGGANRLPSDFELGVNARMSLSPHISLVGSVDQGLARDYLRAAAGARVTATDVDNTSFAIGIGLQYQTSNKPAIRPHEWAPDVSIGWVPWASRPKVSFVGQASYGLTTETIMALVGLRYALAGF